MQVQNLSGVTCVATGDNHSLARKSDGTVWAWGGNGAGQLGDGTTMERHTPVQVRNLSGVTAVASGAEYSLVLKSDGTVWAWGSNGLGQLGDGTNTDRHAPVRVISLSGVTGIAAHALHSLALRITAPPFDGIVRAWGWNFSGQLGDGTTTDRPSPVQAATLSAAEAIAAGTRHSLAVGARRAYLNVRNILVHQRRSGPFTFAQDARRGDPASTTTRNPGSVGRVPLCAPPHRLCWSSALFSSPAVLPSPPCPLRKHEFR